MKLLNECKGNKLTRSQVSLLSLQYTDSISLIYIAVGKFLLAITILIVKVLFLVFIKVFTLENGTFSLTGPQLGRIRDQVKFVEISEVARILPSNLLTWHTKTKSVSWLHVSFRNESIFIVIRTRVGRVHFSVKFCYQSTSLSIAISGYIDPFSKCIRSNSI